MHKGIQAYPWKANDLLFSFAAEHEKNILLGIADSPQTGYADIYTGKSLKFENWEPRGGVLSSVFSSIIRDGYIHTILQVMQMTLCCVTQII